MALLNALCYLHQDSLNSIFLLCLIYLDFSDAIAAIFNLIVLYQRLTWLEIENTCFLIVVYMFLVVQVTERLHGAMSKASIFYLCWTQRDND